MLELIDVKDRGNPSLERAVFRALRDGDIGQTIVLRTKSGINPELKKRQIVATIKSAFWFPDHSVKEDDLVVLYTKSGKIKEKPKNSAGTTSFFFYWGADSALWGDENDALVFGRLADWNNRFFAEIDVEADDSEPEPEPEPEPVA